MKLILWEKSGSISRFPGTEQEFLEIKDFYKKEWKNDNGRYHRSDGPAVIYPDGTQEWWQNGLCHREGGPAKIWTDGIEHWFQNGFLHRDDGPTQIYYTSGLKRWHKNGRDLTWMNNWLPLNYWICGGET